MAEIKIARFLSSLATESRVSPSTHNQALDAILFLPETSHFTGRITGEKRRHHLHESVLQRAFKEARLKPISKPATCLRCDILLRLICCRMAMTFGPFRSWGHKDVRMTMIYTHVLNRGGRGVYSPADSLGLVTSRQYSC